MKRGNVNFRGAFREDSSPVVRYNIETPGLVTISIFSATSQLVMSTSRGVQEIGKYTFAWNTRMDDGQKVPPGYYIGVVTVGSLSILRKVIRVE